MAEWAQTILLAEELDQEGAAEATSSGGAPAADPGAAEQAISGAAAGSGVGASTREDYNSGGSYPSSGGSSAAAALRTASALVQPYLSDPPTVGLFTVFVSMMPGLAFQSCNGLGIEHSVEYIKEGGVNETVWPVPGQSQPGSVTLRRGYMLDPSAAAIALWRTSINSSMVPLTLSGLIILHDDAGLPLGAWFFKKGLLRRWQGPNLTAGAQEVAVEEIEIVHEGLTIIDTALQLVALGVNAASQMGASEAELPSEVIGALGALV